MGKNYLDQVFPCLFEEKEFAKPCLGIDFSFQLFEFKLVVEFIGKLTGGVFVFVVWP